jgi:hypothetical protein
MARKVPHQQFFFILGRITVSRKQLLKAKGVLAHRQAYSRRCPIELLLVLVIIVLSRGFFITFGEHSSNIKKNATHQHQQLLLLSYYYYDLVGPTISAPPVLLMTVKHKELSV